MFRCPKPVIAIATFTLKCFDSSTRSNYAMVLN